MVAGQAQQLGQDPPGLPLRLLELGGIDEVVREGRVPHLDETSDVEDGVAVEVAQAPETRQQAVGNHDHLVAVGPCFDDGRPHGEHLLRGDEDSFAPGRQDPDGLLLHIEPEDLVVVRAGGNAGQVLRELLRDDVRRGVQQDGFHSVLIGAAADVGALPI